MQKAMELLKELWYTHTSEARTVENKDSIKLASIGNEP
jgi:hypothetical protein